MARRTKLHNPFAGRAFVIRAAAGPLGPRGLLSLDIDRSRWIIR
jgi:hypothetical protein